MNLDMCTDCDFNVKTLPCKFSCPILRIAPAPGGNSLCHCDKISARWAGRNRRQAREDAKDKQAIDKYGFTSHWLKKSRKVFSKPIRDQAKAKPKQT